MRASYQLLMLFLVILTGASSAIGQTFRATSEQKQVAAHDEFDAEELMLILLNLDLRREILYAHDRNPLHRMHLMLPRKRTVDEPLPLIVWIHGGGWMVGDKRDMNSQMIPYIRSGRYATATIGYRKSGEVRWPGQIHDCKAAIRWLRAHADEFGYDPDRIAVIGPSAGGHLASMLGTTAGVPELDGRIGRYGDQSTDVACVVDLWGPTDFLQMDAHRPEGATLEHAAPGSPEVRLVGGPFEKKMGLVRSANPITHIDGPTPPFLIIHGTNDMLVPFHQSELLKEALESNGDEVALVTVVNGGHGVKSKEIDDLIYAFFEHNLYGVGDPIEDQTIEVAPPRPERGGKRNRPDRAEGAKSGERPGDSSQARGGERPERPQRGGSREGGQAGGNRGGGGRANRAESFFERADRDGDGRITPQEVPRTSGYARQFEQYDKNKDGSLDLEEFKEMLASGTGNRGNRGGEQPKPPPDQPEGS